MLLRRCLRVGACGSGTPRAVGRAFISSQQAAVALRPFYFEVHPDRFTTEPTVRAVNERSLQAFNGYLSDLFPVQKKPEPIVVHFFIADKGKSRFRKVELRLSGSDASFIVRSALEVCNLPTTKVPASQPRVRSPLENLRHDWEADELLRRYRKKRPSHFVKSNDLLAALKKHREDVHKATRAFRKTWLLLQEEIDEIKEWTGVTEVIWSMNWAVSHMRRSLIALRRLTDSVGLSSDACSVEAALRGSSLRFGRGSFVCCDGGIQFGVDGVPEEWLHVCEEAHVRRAQLPTLRESSAHLSELLGGARVLIPPQHSLAKTVDQLQALIVRIGTREKDEQSCLKELGAETAVEIVTSYDELALGKDGRLLIPCNADVGLLLQFLNTNADRSREVNTAIHQLQSDAENIRRECIFHLKLEDITWQDGVDLRELTSSLQRLKEVDESMHSLIQGVALHFGTNPQIYVMTDGKLSLPLTWI